MAAEVPAALDRVLASEGFSRAERPRRFLSFLVQHVLAGEGDRIDEYLLAKEVFHRKPGFDPVSDPIVRVEAGRLRRKLQEYYKAGGQSDPVWIELPPRSYVPVFHRREPAVRAPAPARFRKSTALSTAAGVLLVLAASWAVVRATRKSGSAQPATGLARSLIVLPFQDLSPNHDQEYFCDGLTDEINESLSLIRDLRVVARTSAFYFKNKPEDVREIGKRLNVGLALEGSVRRAGDRVRINVELINTADGYQLWSQTYDREVRNVIQIQEEIARGIASTLWTELAGSSWRPPTQRSAGVEAYDLYLRGLHAARQWNSAGMIEAMADLERATAADPNYAPAFAALAQYSALLGVHGGLLPSEIMPKAKAAALRALALDPSLGHAHACLALVKAVYDWDWPGATQSFRRAFELDPADANEREMYVMGYLVPLGRLDEALAQVQETQKLDPLSPRTEAILGMVYYFRRQYDLAIEHFLHPVQQQPHYEAAHLAAGSAYAQKARFAEALASLQEGAGAWQSGIDMSLMGHTYALMGRRADAERVLGNLAEMSKTQYVSPAYIAAIYAGLGEKDRAMEWLERAYRVRAGSLVYLKVNPRYDGLRSDARFQDLLRRIGLR